MLEKRFWTNLFYIILVFLTCVAVWQILTDEDHPTNIPQLSPVYSFYNKHFNYSYPLHLLESSDYNRLIDLNFTFNMSSSICNDSSVLLLVLVHSSPLNFRKRDTIRNTWGQSDEKVKVIFVIGLVSSEELQKAIDEEDMFYNDLVQGNFLDTYRNITYKHVMVFKYAIYHCPQAKYVLKTDDDVFVNMPAMKNFLTYDLSLYGGSNMLFCTPRKNKLVLRTYRSKWRVSFTEYPYRNYPTYCPGWTLLYSPDVLFALYKDAQNTDYFWIDDVHITGTLAAKNHITHSDIESLVISTEDLKNIVDDYQYNISRPFLFGRPNLEEYEIRSLWKFVSTHIVPNSLVNEEEE